MTIPLLLQDVDRSAVPRHSEVLLERVERDFRSLAELPTNVEAIDAGLMFATGHTPFVVVVGPSGWGKTHLLECVSNHISREFRIQACIGNAIDWVEGRCNCDAVNPLLLDNVQDVMVRTRTRFQLRMALERRVRIGRPTMLAVTSDRLTRQHITFLPAYREWSLQEIGEPSASERSVVVKKMAERERLNLSRSLLKLIATRMKGNGNTIHGALNRLKLVDSDWTTPADFLRASGILNPFFADNPSWDAMERIRAAADRAHRHYPNVDPCALACHAMIKIAQLSELDVARFCEIRPAKARTMAIAFEKRLQESCELQLAHSHFLDFAVVSLIES